MGQVSAVLRQVEGGYGHWCPGCHSMHVIYTDSDGGPQWTFDGDVDCPTFSPSVRITYNGVDADQERDDEHRAPSSCCHYFVRAGQIEFCGDSTHVFAGQTMPLPDLPEFLQDPKVHWCEIVEDACADDAMGAGANFAAHVHEHCAATHKS